MLPVVVVPDVVAVVSVVLVLDGAMNIKKGISKTVDKQCSFLYLTFFINHFLIPMLEFINNNLQSGKS